MTDQTVKEWRKPGTRNLIRVGDVVKVAPTAPKKRDGFEARVVAIYVQWEEQDDGTPERVVFEVVGGCRGRYHTRFIRAERIGRVAQVRTSADGIQTKRERKR